MRRSGSLPLRVQTLFLHPFLGWRATDHFYNKRLKELEGIFPLEIRLCTALLPVALGNILHAADALDRRFARRIGVRMPGWWSTLRRLTIIPESQIGAQTDLLYTNYLIPVNRITAPIVVEWDFFIYGPPNEEKILRQSLHVPAWFIRRATLVVVRHELSRAAFTAKYPQDAEKCVIVPFYLPWLEPVLEEHVIRRFGRFDDGEVQLLFVGNDARRKGLPDLAEGYRRLRLSGRRVRLTIVSEFSDGPVQLPPDTIVHSRLSPHDVYALMAKSHIFTMPTRRDAYPLVYWEAMANGCALLVPNTSPHRELFGEYGLIVPPGDVAAITAALERFLDDGEFTRSCALRGRQAFVKHFHHSIVGKQYWEVFRRAVGNGSPPS
jgi:glycosyltransferase involved in cell wall biosynthesis